MFLSEFLHEKNPQEKRVETLGGWEKDSGALICEILLCLCILCHNLKRQIRFRFESKISHIGVCL